ncbi:hypothetical protein GII32_11835 [Gordonia amarae]|uniref:hypothetical protein n=1 Tax=Gordonia amarae TaxID=36821 RepID=UPI001AF46150|nr:hypothetical protein [Gordonia amarae]QHN30989.1 hypothetical protein GII32_11835 [Gordonia amarae]
MQYDTGTPPAAVPTAGRPWTRRPALAALPVYALAVTLTFANTPDDGFITLRIADNLIHHGRPDFNFGDAVEGYSSPLHLLLSAVVALLPAAYTGLALKLIGVVFGALTLWPAARIARNCGLGPRGVLLSTLMVAVSWNFAASSSNLLESSLTAFLLTGLLASLTAAPYRHAAVWSGLLVLARPESVLVVGVLTCGWLFWSRADGSRTVRWFVAPVAAAAVVFGHRLIYFGELMPNTYHAKDVSLSESLIWGLGYVIDSHPWAGTSNVLVLLTLTVQFVLFIVAANAWRRTSPLLLLLPLAILVQVAFILRSGGDWMFGARHWAPVVPAMAVIAVVAVRACTHALAARSRASRPAAVGSVLMGLVLLLQAGPGLHTYHPAWLLDGVDNRDLIAVGGYGPYSQSWITSTEMTSCLPTGTVIAFSEIGYFGYTNRELRVIDTRGLTDNQIAGNAGPSLKLRTGVHDPHWFDTDSVVGAALIDRDPDILLVLPTADPHADELGPQPPTALGGRYTRIRSREVLDPDGTGSLTLTVYARTGSPDYPCLRTE